LLKILNQQLRLFTKFSTKVIPRSVSFENILEYLRLVLLFRFSPQFAATVSSDLQADVVTEIKTWAGEKNIYQCRIGCRISQYSWRDQEKSTIAYLPLELALMRILES
jgi:hypothetical protein